MILETIVSSAGNVKTTYPEIKEGFFSLHDNIFNIDGIDLMILPRRKLQRDKPEYYIMAKTQPIDKYVSSLFPTDDDSIYTIEYKNKYRLKFISTGVFITIIE